jgi:hypothetical protein
MNYYSIFIFISLLYIAILYYRIAFLQTRIENIIHKKETTVFSYLIWFSKNFGFFYKYNFTSSYEDKNVLYLSKKHDKLVTVLYLSVPVIIIFGGVISYYSHKMGSGKVGSATFSVPQYASFLSPRKLKYLFSAASFFHQHV